MGQDRGVSLDPVVTASGEQTPDQAAVTLRAWLEDTGLEFEAPTAYRFIAVLPGVQKLRTPLAMDVGTSSLTVDAFVVRHPDENTEQVQRFLLQRNRRIFALAYTVDQHGDIYLGGRLPLSAVTPLTLDRVAGAVLEHGDGVFNHLLELGFPGAIRREWAWRLARGESTDNLAAFPHLRGGP